MDGGSQLRYFAALKISSARCPDVAQYWRVFVSRAPVRSGIAECKQKAREPALTVSVAAHAKIQQPDTIWNSNVEIWEGFFPATSGRAAKADMADLFARKHLSCWPRRVGCPGRMGSEHVEHTGNWLASTVCVAADAAKTKKPSHNSPAIAAAPPAAAKVR